ncbi:hypothetical protein SFA35_06040 [Pseudomonas sp. HR96]|uniref:hypothetical protein n=1 Tax=Pseudomonas sp. HR96 TaxID=1027966 RepID=UPI002A758385|nr:hypothetical protein [Pseudomonas sp. HR96]WPP00927.1 hypothetical protein SFA35_06040 [Pseudomonas sp. HR96]
MDIDRINLEQNVGKTASRLLAAIEKSDSMLQGVKAGARAEGFMLGLEAAGGLDAEQLEALGVLFEETTERRLSEIAASVQR